MNIDKDYYALIGLAMNTEVQVIETVQRALRRKYHPEHYTGPKDLGQEITSELNEVFNVLLDPVSRKKYDTAREEMTDYIGDIEDTVLEDQINSDKDTLYDPVLEESWKLAVDIYPEINIHRLKLKKLSSTLSLSFAAYLENKKAYSKAEAIAHEFENRFLETFFGTDTEIKKLATQLLVRGMKDVAINLNQTFKVIGLPPDSEAFVKKFLKNRGLAYSYDGDLYKSQFKAAEQKLDDSENQIKSIDSISKMVVALIAIVFIVGFITLVRNVN